MKIFWLIVVAALSFSLGRLAHDPHHIAPDLWDGWLGYSVDGSVPILPNCWPGGWPGGWQGDWTANGWTGDSKSHFTLRIPDRPLPDCWGSK